MTLSRAAAFVLVGLTVPLLTSGRGGALPLGAQSTTSRTVVVVSDLHLGVGSDRSGEWSAYEDFRWAAEFAAFLERVDRDGASAVDLVLNGDTFDLLESGGGVGCAGGAGAGGCTEAEALERLDRSVAAHGAELTALGRFARRGANRVALVPGDHDAALLFPAVGRRAVGAAGAPQGRVEVRASGDWWSADGRIVAEHGHQIALSAHRFDGWPTPFRRAAGQQRLERPWGEALVQPLYGQLEPGYPVVDNLAITGAGLRYALAAEGAPSDHLAAQLLRYLLFALSWQQFRMELDDGDVKPPVWDLARVRAQGASFLVSGIPDDDPFKRVAARSLSEGLGKALEDLSDEELTALCDYRAAVRRARRRFEPLLTQLDPRGPVVAECPRTPETRGAVFDYFWRSRDHVFGRHIDATAGRRPGSGPPVAVYVHGHTHLPDRAQTTANLISGGLLKIPMEGFSPVRGALTPVAINAGAWQRTMTPVELERRAAARGVSASDLLRSLRPEELPPCYSFVLIPPYTSEPQPVLRYWRRSASGEWEIAPACGG